MDVALACEEEIVGLHRFFQEWFLGGFSDRKRGFKRFTDVMDPAFVMVSPQGVAIALPDLSAGLNGAFGTWQSGSSIEVVDVSLRHVHADLALLTYVETQHVKGEDTARLSTVLMRQREATPNGVQWLHVHETWVAGHEG
ncbi:MAG: hypothetical protein KUG77_29555 [Nannocystaceae bacterium]|nr:hypothetical protein [Nannocystaceae bacterium]